MIKPDPSILRYAHYIHIQPRGRTTADSHELTDWIRNETKGQVGMLSGHDMAFLNVKDDVLEQTVPKDDPLSPITIKGFNLFLLFEDPDDLLRFKLTWG